MTCLDTWYSSLARWLCVEINLWPSLRLYQRISEFFAAQLSIALHPLCNACTLHCLCIILARTCLIDLHSRASPLSAHHTWGPELACGCHRPSPRHAIDDSYSLMKLYSSFLSRAALTRWTLTIHPLSGTHLFPLLLRVLTSHLLPERLVSATEGWMLLHAAC